MAVKRISAATLKHLTEELASHPWREAELAELANPQLGLITGFQDVLDGLDELRRIDLGDLPPAGPVKSDKP